MGKRSPKTGQKLVDDRDQNGRFVKGHSGNGGRPKLPEEVREMCRALTPEAIRTAERIMLDGEAKPADRLKAAEIILDRGCGKPAQSVAIETETAPRFIFVGMDDVKD